MPTEPPCVATAIVVGGGIGGLVTALTLARRGLEVTVLERTSTSMEAGAGIQLSPNASRILHALGLERPIDEVSFAPEAAEIYTWRRGTRLLRLPLGAAMEARLGAPYLHVHRADLHRVLAEAAREQRRVEIHFDAACEHVEPGPDAVRVTTTAGRRFTADLVVGADGIRSTVRSAVFGPDRPQFTGCVAWRGLVDASRVDVDRVRPVAALWVGPGAHFVHYYVRGGQLVNFVGVVERTGWTHESWTERGDRSELIESFAGWHPTVCDLLRASDPQGCFQWALFDRDPLPQWSKGRVTLLGDACHPMLPFLAQGASMAIEDAVVLAECLGARRLPEALARYEVLRRDRTAAIQLASRRNGLLYHMRGPRAWLRNAVLRLMGRRIGRRTDRIYAYDAWAQARAGEAPR